MSEGSKAFQPLLGSSTAGLAFKWSTLRADAAGPEDWEPWHLMNEEGSWHIATVAQGAYSRQVAERHS
jgi:hypothetical protein